MKAGSFKYHEPVTREQHYNRVKSMIERESRDLKALIGGQSLPAGYKKELTRIAINIINS